MSMTDFAIPSAQHKMAAPRGEISQAEKDALIQKKIAWHESVLEVSELVRSLVRTSQPVLYHGTRYANQILRDNRLLYPDVGTFSVHFTRELPIATHWASLPRVEGDEDIGAVLVFDRDRLAQDFTIKCFRDPILDNGAYPQYHNEADEIIYRRDVVGLHKYLIDVVWIDEKPIQVRSAKQVREQRASNSPRSGGSGLPWPGSRILNAGQQKPSATRHSPAHRQWPPSRTWASISAAERSAVTNVRTVFRDFENPSLQMIVLGALATHLPSTLAELIARDHKTQRNARARKRRRKGPSINQNRRRDRANVRKRVSAAGRPSPKVGGQ